MNYDDSLLTEELLVCFLSLCLIWLDPSVLDQHPVLSIIFLLALLISWLI